MLTKDEEKYLEAIPEDRKIYIQDFNPAVKVSSDKLVSKIKVNNPNWNIWPMGSSELNISGQNDIDINIPIHPNEVSQYLPKLESLFGPPRQTEKLPMKWVLDQDGFEVELYLTDSTTETFKKHLHVFTTLKENEQLRNEYEEIKKSCNGDSFKEYMRKKYEFYHKIIGDMDGESGVIAENQDLK